MKVLKDIFNFICSQVIPLMLKKYINMCFAIWLKTKVAIRISKLAIKVGMQVIANIFGVGLTSHNVFVEFFFLVKMNMKKSYIKWP
jgi:hypothetical protein